MRHSCNRSLVALLHQRYVLPFVSIHDGLWLSHAWFMSSLHMRHRGDATTLRRLSSSRSRATSTPYQRHHPGHASFFVSSQSALCSAGLFNIIHIIGHSRRVISGRYIGLPLWSRAPGPVGTDRIIWTGTPPAPPTRVPSPPARVPSLNLAMCLRTGPFPPTCILFIHLYNFYTLSPNLVMVSTP